MEKAVAMGKVRALGISNFDASDEVFNKIMTESRVKPAVLQIECHPYAQRLAMREKVKPYGIHVTCWFPLGGAMSNGALFKDPAIISIASRAVSIAFTSSQSGGCPPHLCSLSAGTSGVFREWG